MVPAGNKATRLSSVNHTTKTIHHHHHHHHHHKRFDNEKLRESLVTYFTTGKNISYDVFENLVLFTFDKMAPIKQKHICGNQSPLMNKDIHKVIMTGTRLRNIKKQDS